MPTIEVEEVEFTRRENLRRAVEQMMAHPKASRLVEQALKEVDPTAKTPRLDADAQAEAARKGETDRLAALEAKYESDKAERDKADRLRGLETSWEKGRAKLKAAGYSDEGLTAVEALMEKHNIIDHDVGQSHFEKLHPPAETATPSGYGSSWNFFEQQSADGQDNIKKLIESQGEDDHITNKMIAETLNEVRGQASRR